jgi:hypothetical protein
MFSKNIYDEEYERFQQEEKFGTEEPIDIKTKEGFELLQKSDSAIIPKKISKEDCEIDIMSFSEQELEHFIGEVEIDLMVDFSSRYPSQMLPISHKFSRKNYGFNTILFQLLECDQIEKILLLNDKVKLFSSLNNEFLIDPGSFHFSLSQLIKWIKENTNLKMLRI